MMNVRMVVIRLCSVCRWRLRELDKGRPEKTWLNCVKNDMKSFAPSLEDSHDKSVREFMCLCGRTFVVIDTCTLEPGSCSRHLYIELYQLLQCSELVVRNNEPSIHLYS